jgi:hypothetical protein
MKKATDFALSVLCALVLAAVALNVWLSHSNRSLQADVNSRAQYLQQSAQLENLYREIVKALAELAVKSNDRQVIGMLQSQGISVIANAPAAVTPQR